jgi:hypothetical protein
MIYFSGGGRHAFIRPLVEYKHVLCQNIDFDLSRMINKSLFVCNQSTCLYSGGSRKKSMPPAAGKEAWPPYQPRCQVSEFYHLITLPDFYTLAAFF